MISLWESDLALRCVNLQGASYLRVSEEVSLRFMKTDRGLRPLALIALGAVLLTSLWGAAAIIVPLLGTLALAYFAFTTPPPQWRTGDKSARRR
jgi:hypothetical protein